MSNNNNKFKSFTSSDAVRIIGIQFSILSPDEIRKSSVAEITSKDAFVNNKPVMNGLFDPRMGVLEPGLLCPTDGLDYMHTPGYFGHINLGRPVFYIQYFVTIHKIMRCICIKCSKLLISKTKHEHLLKMLPENRWDVVYNQGNSSKIRRCGDDTDDGCGCKQPKKIKKEGFAKLVASWEDADDEKMSMTLTPDIILKCFRRISDDDILFMGFSPIWSRPEFMICQVLAIPPPAVRPSVKHDAQQRSEDDITHIIINIIKTNNTLLDKIKTDAPSNIIDDWTHVLQYFVATMIDNKIPGVAAVVQRSGRPLKSIKDRMVGKTGRMRGNLMGKRVDYSGRSVITPDPNIATTELGVPLKIAKNLTKPVVVNNRNMKFLRKLIENGPDVYPGAKIIVKLSGTHVSLRYVDIKTIILEVGDIVHRHMMDGDCVLFNRQPTLHRMSMMGHIVRIMPEGDTFRMNVACTKPYNADFDGDEMNLHMPQDNESETELRHLAAVPYQIISPANNKPIIGIFQDSLLGINRFSRSNIVFNKRSSMNLLMAVSHINLDLLLQNETSTSFNILSHILPPLSIQYKTKRWKDADDYKTSANVLEIKNGIFMRGQIDKSVLGDGSNGLIHRICNDYGNIKAVQFIDDIQNISTEYMKTSGFSVGISDLISNADTIKRISDNIDSKIIEVDTIIDQIHLGVFNNKSGRPNDVEFELRVNNVLSKANEQAGKIGRESLQKDNRFVTMVNAGSKGSELNISQMLSCLGQQNIDNKRIPYGFENRTLPHFSKYDDSAEARGFVANSFISGLSPTEFFFHAMGGRIGIIDTAVKTSQTGYIQRRLIKGLEDLKIEYDMTVRNSMFKVIQFNYGECGFDSIKVEMQSIPIVKMSIPSMFTYFTLQLSDIKKILTRECITRMNKVDDHDASYQRREYEIIEMMLENKTEIIKNVFGFRDNNMVNVPVSFTHIIDNVRHNHNLTDDSLVDITPLETVEMIDGCIEKLMSNSFIVPNRLFIILYYYYINTKSLIVKYRFNKNALTILLEQIRIAYIRAIVAPGEMVGMIAAQSIGEPTTQMTLNTFHFAGVASKSNVTRGLPRLEEIISLSENTKNPSCTVYLHPTDETSQEEAIKLVHKLEHTRLRSIVSNVKILFDPGNDIVHEDNQLVENFSMFNEMINTYNDEVDTGTDDTKSKWLIRMEMNRFEMLERNITMDDVNFMIKTSYNDVSCMYSDFNNSNLVFRIRVNKKTLTGTLVSPDQTDELIYLKNFQNILLDNLVLRGIKQIKKVTPRKILDSMILENGDFVKKQTWVLDTVGSNLMGLLGCDFIDNTRTMTNNIQEVYNVLGIEAARQTIFNELSEVIEFDSTYINYNHIILLCDRMTCNDGMVSIFRHGINNDNIGPIAKASFEETPEMFLNAAKHAELDILRGVSANVMCGQEGFFGTNAFQIVLDMDKFSLLPHQVDKVSEKEDSSSIVKKNVGKCSPHHIKLSEPNMDQLSGIDYGDEDTAYVM